MIISILRLLLFSISMGGYVIFIQRKSKIKIEFLPIISISAISVILFFGGLLNILPFISVVIFLTGIILFIRGNNSYFSKASWRKNVNALLTPGVIIMTLLAIYFLFLFKDQRLMHYDNFSHWAIIVKNILMDDALPNFEDSIISFNSYPPGSALFIYYFCKIVGKTEGFALFGQLIIILSGLLTIFSFSSFKLTDLRKSENFPIKKILLNIITVFVVIYLLNGPSSIHDLLVDNLLTIVSISMFSLVYFYQNSPEIIYIPLVFMTTFLTIIKNSGMFFAAFPLLVYGIGIIKNAKEKNMRIFNNFERKYIHLFIPFFAPVIAYRLWTRHVSMVFSTESLGKHTMNLNSYIVTFNEKTTFELKEITDNFFDTLVTDYGPQILMLMLILIGFTMLYYILQKKIDKRILILTGVILIIFILYNLGLWIMYLVSMPTSEALYLAGYSRYMETMVNFLFGIASIGMLSALNNINSTLLFNISNTIMLICLILLTFEGDNFQDIKNNFNKQVINTSTNQLSLLKIEKSLSHLNPNPMVSTTDLKKYYFYIPNVDSIGYASYYLDYRLYQKDVRYTLNVDNLSGLWEYDYLSITEVNDEIIDYFSDHALVNPEIGTYTIDKENHRIGRKLPNY